MLKNKDLFKDHFSKNKTKLFLLHSPVNNPLPWYQHRGLPGIKNQFSSIIPSPRTNPLVQLQHNRLFSTSSFAELFLSYSHVKEHSPRTSPPLLIQDCFCFTFNQDLNEEFHCLKNTQSQAGPTQKQQGKARALPAPAAAAPKDSTSWASRSS